MKTLPTLATAVIAAFLVLGPAVAFAATTVSVATNTNSYNGVQTVAVTGTVSPAPAAGTSVVITTKGPSGVVDIGSVPVNSGAFSYAFVTGGSTNWVTGTFTVNATWGGPGGSASGTTQFVYMSTGCTGTNCGGGSSLMGINVQVTTQTPVYPGQQEYIGILTSYDSNGSLAAATFQTIHYHTPQGTLVTLCSSAGQTGCTGTFTTIHTGFYTINFSIPATATQGGYFVHAWTNGPKNIASTGQGQGLGQFTINPQIANQGSFAALTASEAAITSSLATIQSSLGAISGLTTGLASLTTSVNTMQSTVNTISSGLTTLSNNLQTINTAAQNLSGLTAQLNTVNSNVANSQTYVLVVAALAAITLVLELAILVRKLS